MLVLNMTYENNKVLHPEWKISNTPKSETGIELYNVLHPDKNFPTSVWVADPNSEFDVVSACAWVAAKTSRSQLEYDQAFRELKEAMDKNPALAAQKLVNVFEGYGHGSVADMAPVFMFMNDIPIYQAYEIFYNISVGAGQETSTRYIEFDDFHIDSPEILLPMEKASESESKEINERWNLLQEHLRENYYKWKAKITKVYDEKYPGTKISTLDARVFDIARQWIPMGARTSMSLLMSTRNWVDLVKALKQSNDISNNVLGEQLMQSLSLSNTDQGNNIKMQLGSLLKHNTPTHTIPNNLESLGEHLKSLPELVQNIDNLSGNEVFDTQSTSVESYKIDNTIGMALQYILTLHPELDTRPLIEWLTNLDENEIVEMGRIIFEGHNNHDQITNAGDIRGDGFFELITAISYLRDLNRHKATGRFTEIFLSKDPFALLRHGFNLNHQVFNTIGFEDLRDQWRSDGETIIQELRDLSKLITRVFPDQDSRWLLRLLPLGVNSRFHISGPLNQLHYLTDLRQQRGGDFGYVVIAQKMIDLMKKKPFLRKAFPRSIPLDVESKEEFQSRN